MSKTKKFLLVVGVMWFIGLLIAISNGTNENRQPTQLSPSDKRAEREAREAEYIRTSQAACESFKRNSGSTGTCEVQDMYVTYSGADDPYQIDFVTVHNKLDVGEKSDTDGSYEIANIPEKIFSASLDSMGFAGIDLEKVRALVNDSFALEVSRLGTGAASFDQRVLTRCIDGFTVSSGTSDAKPMLDWFAAEHRAMGGKDRPATTKRFWFGLSFTRGCATAEITAPVNSVEPPKNPSSTPSICDDLDTKVTVDLRECLNRQLIRSDAELNAIWKSLPNTVTKELLPAQRKWIAEKDASCAEASQEFEGGTFAEISQLDCQLKLTEERVEFLKARQ